MTNPLNYPITSPYGIPRTYTVSGVMYRDVHDGIDFAYPQGTPVTLPPNGDFDGVVTYAGLDQYGGGYVDIKANDGGVLRLLHLSRIDVKKGDKVTSNQQIGLSGGAKGTWGAGLSTGAHLHLGLLVNNRAVDPLPHLKKAYETIINPNELSMTEKEQLNNYIKAHQEALNNPDFEKLQEDEKNAIVGEKPNFGYYVSRVKGLREEALRLEKERLELSMKVHSLQSEVMTERPATLFITKDIKKTDLVPNNGLNSSISTLLISLGGTAITLGLLSPEQVATFANPDFIASLGSLATAGGLIYNHLRYKK